jgi:hypothetical protein
LILSLSSMRKHVGMFSLPLFDFRGKFVDHRAFTHYT